MPPEHVLNLVRSWFTKAEHDLRNIELVLPDPECPYDTVCFHAQQAAEKYVKGYLTYFGIPFPKTHEMEKLADLVPGNIRPDLPLEDFENLSQSAVIPRYPGLFIDEPDREQAEQAQEIALKVKTVILSALAREGFSI